MKCILVVVLLMLNIGVSNGADKTQALAVNCEDYSWGDIGFMVQDYLGDMLSATFVMQGQSSNYSISSAAMQAMATPELLPADVKRELQAIIDAC